jgi:hypothetical protein
MGKYDDIIHLPHHVSAKHPQMPALDRAAQFSPFAALTGYETAIAETARLVDRRIELDENRKEELDEKLQMAREQLALEPEIAVTYFVPDAKKDGGAYVQTIGIIKKLDDIGQRIFMKDGTVIPICDIYGLESSIFRSVD